MFILRKDKEYVIDGDFIEVVLFVVVMKVGLIKENI